MKKNLQCLSLKRQQGVVIVVALFIVALVATMAYFMMGRLQRDTRRTTLIIRNIQAEEYAQGSIAWGRDQLYNNWVRQHKNRLIDVTPIKPKPVEMNNYKIESVIYDLQGRFNLNNLSKTDQEAQAVFRRLLLLCVPTLDALKANAILAATVDWITPGEMQNEYTRYYASLPTPYRPAHRPMLDSSEFRLVKGVTPAIYDALIPYVTALPNDATINIQTAPIMVLMSLNKAITLEMAQSIIKDRKESPILSKDAFAKKYNVGSNMNIDVKSSYFLLMTDVSIDDQHSRLYTLLKRNVNNNNALISILWQTKSLEAASYEQTP